MTTNDAPRWFTSSYSNNGGNCVEAAVNLAVSHGVIPVRDTKDRTAGTMAVSPGAWSAFVTLVKGAQV